MNGIWPKAVFIALCVFCICGSSLARPAARHHRFRRAGSSSSGSSSGSGETYRPQTTAYPEPGPDGRATILQEGHVIHTATLKPTGTVKLATGVRIKSEAGHGPSHFGVYFTLPNGITRRHRWLQFISRGGVVKPKNAALKPMAASCKGKSGLFYDARSDTFLSAGSSVSSSSSSSSGGSAAAANWGIDTCSPQYKNSLGIVAPDPVRGIPFYDYRWANYRTADEIAIFDRPSATCSEMGDAFAFPPDTEYAITRVYFVDILLNGPTPLYQIAHHLEWRFNNKAEWDARNGRLAPDTHTVTSGEQITAVPATLLQRLTQTYPDFATRAAAVP